MIKIFMKMLEAIKSKKEQELLRFGDFEIIKKLGEGEQGIVVLAKNPNGKLCAIKFYSPVEEKNKENIIKGEKRFKREVEILLKLKHHNITNIYIAGSAKWNEKIKKWYTSYNPLNPGKILFYVMDYIKGKSVKSIFYKLRIKNKDVIDLKKCNVNNLKLFELLIIQMSDCMNFFHNNKIAHRDIKPDNIIYSEHDNTFILVDFGFAKYSQRRVSDSPEETIRKKLRIDLASEKLGKNDYLADQYIFSEMLLEILELFSSLYLEYNYKGLESSITKGVGSREDRYMNMKKFKKAIDLYLYSSPYHSHNFRINSFLIPNRLFGHFQDIIRIPISGSVPMFKEILQIINTSEFQRLKGIKQLGYTNFVYPGANHTRFEHSLGAYSLSLKYLEVLLKNPKFCESIKPIDESIKLVVLASLLHDIGHYPYAHWIEELEGLPNGLAFESHENRSKQIIEKSKIGEIITKKWEIDIDKVCKLIIGGEDLSRREKLLRSVIHELIDVDKMDYLQRDSAHCGVPYGTAFDIERLINSLYINDENDKICLTEKGRSPFLAYLMSNIVMYQEVYWHKTVRACTAMFKRIFYNFLISEKKDNNFQKMKQELFFCTDDRFIEYIYTKFKDKRNLSKLILPFMYKDRLLYKPAYVHFHEHELYTKNENTIKFFEKYSKSSYPDQIKMSDCLVKVLKDFTNNREIHLTDIILETTPIKYRERPELIGFKFYDLRKAEYSILSSEVKQLNKYLDTNRRSYIFCNPDYYNQIKEISASENLDNILGKVIEIISHKKKP